MQKEAGCMNKEGPWAIMGGVVLKVLEDADLGIGIGMRKKNGYWRTLPARNQNFFDVFLMEGGVPSCCLVAGTWV